ncbi:hypothetical protein CYMTET_5403 [Cymbomonas tetramitiformis]|uniref:Uncharacterized protein n=1 Tax=Cymbomonas tetramitiformis TaxID=36881 RepID=A0AAE0LIX4_9CHLO|nr:hypothetical protein CYMTET_5403 [Cymbomonas tetramitiformis]
MRCELSNTPLRTRPVSKQHTTAHAPSVEASRTWGRSPPCPACCETTKAGNLDNRREANVLEHSIRIARATKPSSRASSWRRVTSTFSPHIL